MWLAPAVWGGPATDVRDLGALAAGARELVGAARLTPAAWLGHVSDVCDLGGAVWLAPATGRARS
ncbi:tryptophanase [Streptomyces azureus]|uniref:Tryptophanase n=1 Tax=Streptomyces azureus TaxID=146537 RepID=A0A0K8PP91_STRAJ|nr:tryptophanase [Streptomyces azureus]